MAKKTSLSKTPPTNSRLRRSCKSAAARAASPGALFDATPVARHAYLHVQRRLQIAIEDQAEGELPQPVKIKHSD